MQRVTRKCFELLTASLLAVIIMGVEISLPAQETDLSLHDPSTLVKQGRTYWVFSTGRGCRSFSSLDRVHWTARGSVFPTPPAWIKASVPSNKGNYLWAPDVRLVRGKYYLYYAASSFGSNTSAIGLATSKSLDPPAWTDQGMVIQSGVHNNYNAIDPCVIQSPDGKLWLGFGSFWSGIKLVQMDPKTGMRISPNSPLYALADHPQERNHAIEAPFIHYRKGYYYLFVNWDYCCRGDQSTYNIRVGRSRRITGPYLDREGVDMLHGGGTLLLDSGSSSAAKGNAVRVGPGHAGILSEHGIDRFSFHYEYNGQRESKSWFEVGTVDWGSDGWPRIVLPHEAASPTGT